MSALAEKLFFTQAEMDPHRVQRIVADTLTGADDGELFLEYRESEGFAFDDGRLKAATFDSAQGFGLRCVAGESTGYAHATELSEAAIKRAADAAGSVRSGRDARAAETPAPTNRRLYDDANPLTQVPFDVKTTLLAEIDAYARSKDSRVKQVSCSLYGEWQVVHILRADGQAVSDVRPLVRLNVSVVVEQDGRQETGSYGAGGREGYAAFIDPRAWHGHVDEALRQALVNLSAEAAPAGEMQVVLGPGWPGILLHEAIGHGLEGDFNRKGTSAFAGLLGKRVAAPGVTVVDDGTMDKRRGSLSVDDEGTPTSRTTLIEDGILVGFLQDRQNARLMGMKPTGNGRRQSFAHPILPRMTNTIMLGGDKSPEEVIKAAKNGIYAVNFGGGQVDITNGKFVFSCTEAYRIQDGRIGAPIKGATLIGSGADALTRVKMVANDFAMDPGIGTCGKSGQGVPVGVGQPSMLIEGLTVGGTAAA
ncbi:MAG: metalloprotease TldD [Alphaproteobacteria bacterium]|nr:metalloprotease TldD [Alphaproteobacteria bacterium]